MKQEFKTNCTDGGAHEPQKIKSKTVCVKCYRSILQTNEGSGVWFSKEDFKVWDRLN